MYGFLLCVGMIMLIFALMISSFEMACLAVVILAIPATNLVEERR